MEDDAGRCAAAGSGDDAELDNYVDGEDADSAADEALAEYWEEIGGEDDTGMADTAEPSDMEYLEDARDFSALNDPDPLDELDWLKEQDA